jgi:integrase
MKVRGVRLNGTKIQIRYEHKGKAHHEQLDLAWSPANVRAASRLREERLRRLRAGLPAIPEPTVPEPTTSYGMNLRDVAQQYLDHVVDEATEPDDPFRLKQSTRDGYRDLLNVYWIPYLGDRVIESITTDDLRAAMKGAKWKSKRRENALGALRQVFAWAVHEDAAIGKTRYIDANPTFALTANVKKRRMTKKAPPDKYSPEDRDTLLTWLKAHAPVSTYAFYLLAFYSGMRTGELLALTWADYDGESLSVTKARVRSKVTTTKNEEHRRVLIPAWVSAVLNGLPSRFKRKEIFLTDYGLPYMRAAHMTEFFEKAHEKTSVKRSRQPNYPWRHTYASIGLTNRLSPAFLAKQLGHTLAVFYSTYAAWIDSDSDRESVERVFGTSSAEPASADAKSG